MSSAAAQPVIKNNYSKQKVHDMKRIKFKTLRKWLQLIINLKWSHNCAIRTVNKKVENLEISLGRDLQYHSRDSAKTANFCAWARTYLRIKIQAQSTLLCHFYFTPTASIHNYNTRSTSHNNLYLSSINSSAAKNAIQFKSVQIWNSLSPEWKNFPFYKFKRFMKDHLISKY